MTQSDLPIKTQRVDSFKNLGPALRLTYILYIYTHYGNLLDSYSQNNTIFNGFAYFRRVFCVLKSSMGVIIVRLHIQKEVGNQQGVGEGKQAGAAKTGRDQSIQNRNR